MSCTTPPRMVQSFHYDIPKSAVLEKCRNILIKLDYEIDIYATESNMLITRPIQLRRALRRYDYIVNLQVNDRIQVHVAAERSIFKRGSQSTFGGDNQIEKQAESTMPIRLQKKIYKPIHRGMIKNNFRPNKISK